MRSPVTAPVVTFDEFCALRRRVDALEAQVAPTAAADAAWLLTIATATGGRVFSATELFDHAIVDASLRHALRGLTSRRLGKRLRALAARPVDGGPRVECVGRDQWGALWRVVL